MILRVSIILSILFLLNGCRGKDPGSHYRRHHDGESLYILLNKYIKTGDTYSKVSELLGSSKVSQLSKKLQLVITKLAEKNPEKYPDGVDDEDVFYEYPIEENKFMKPRRIVVTVYLQFRNGMLINHSPEDFLEYNESDLVLH